MRFVRGAGTRGLAGIYPLHREDRGAIIRPLLDISRTEVESYLHVLQQPWREDASNADLHHTRNRVRHRLLPTLRNEYNPNIDASLARLAAIARDEEDYWAAECSRLLPFVLLPGKPVRGGGRAAGRTISIALNIEALAKHPPALQRRLIRAAAETLPLRMDSEQVEHALELAFTPGKSGKVLELHGGWALRRSFRELAFEPAKARAKMPDYSYRLPLGHSLQVAEAGTRLQIGAAAGADIEGYNRQNSLVELQPDDSFIVRNWRAGDRLVAHSGRARKVKELLQQMQVPVAARAGWPVVELDGRVIWMRGMPSPPLALRTPQGWATVVITEIEENE
jgi:tRNA(Ile)-lysidine synthase